MLGLEIERGDVVQAQRQPVTLLVVPGGPGLGQLLWARVSCPCLLMIRGVLSPAAAGRW